MADPTTVRGLLRGAFDTHIHSAPDVLPRKFNDIELAQRSREVGMAGFVLKSHFACTADRATLIREMFPDVQAFGSIVLNHAVGGLNPIAVDIAGRLGARVVWLPTVDSANELASIAGQADETKLPYWMSIAREMRALGITGEPITAVDEDGKVAPRLRQCLDIIAKHDMVLATGHIAPREMLPVVKAAKEAGVQRIIITHPEFPSTFLTVEQHKELLPYNVFFERCYTQPATGKVSWERVIANVKEVGASTTMLATDLGQKNALYVDEGLEVFIGKLLDAGFSESELEGMVAHNPAQVLGATTAVAAD